MIQKFILTISVLLISVSCSHQYSDFFPYRDDGTPKPKVAMLPVLDMTCGGKQDPFASMSDDMIRSLLMCHGELFLYDKDKIENLLSRATNVDYFGKDLSYSKQFCGADFVVAIALVEHRIIPYENESKPRVNNSCHNAPCQSLLELKMRLRIIDLTCDTPRVILQEYREFSHIVTLPGDWESKPSLASWEYVEDKIVRDIVARMEQEIWSSH